MYNLSLYISNHSETTERTIKRLKETLDRECTEPYELTVLDIFKNIEKAYEDKILVTPTLIKNLPEPSARVVGNLSDGNRVLSYLDMCLENG